MAVNVPLQTVFANTRAGTVYQTTSAGGIEAVSANTTRTAHWRGGKPHFLFEPSRTNSIRNNTNVGAATGTLSTTGALPTNWLIAGIASSAVTVNGFGTEDGLPYIEVRLNGTPTSSIDMVFDTSTGIAASDGQDWTHSVYLKQISGSQANITSVSVGNLRYTSAPATHSSAFGVVSLTTARQRLTYIDTSVDDADGTGAISYIRPTVRLAWTSGAIDITLRIYAPQMELGAFATSPILTSGSAVIRAADSPTCSVSTFPIDQNGGSIEIIGRADYTTGGSAFPRVFQIDDGTNDNRISLLVNEASGLMVLTVFLAGAAQATETISYTSGAEFAAMLTFAEDNVFLSLNGSDSTPDTTASFPTGLLTAWRWARSATGDNGATVLINRIASHSHEFSTTGANAITA